MHITWKELRAVRLAVEHFLPELMGRRVLLREDNMAVVYILTNMVTRSPALMAELRRLCLLLDACDIELRPLYIRSAANLVADYASRLACSGDYALARARFDALQAQWGACTVDAFASPATAPCRDLECNTGWPTPPSFVSVHSSRHLNFAAGARFGSGKPFSAPHRNFAGSTLKGRCGWTDKAIGIARASGCELGWIGST